MARAWLLLLALAALSGLVAVSMWATQQQSIAPAIQDLLANPGDGNNPWFWATLADAYFGFLWFWAWVAYRERSAAARALWLLLILALGNMAMAAYMLLVLWRLPPGATARDVLLRAEDRGRA